MCHWLLDYMHNGNKHVHIDTLGRNILGHDAHSNVGKYITDNMAFGVASQPSWKYNLRQTHSPLTDEIN